MADLSVPASPRRWRALITPWSFAAAIMAALAVMDLPAVLPTLSFTLQALAGTAPFILFAVLAVAYLKATSAETLLARAFEGNPARMILLAALLGGLSPFCSCEVIPFIAALLAVGAPLGAVMAFWLASPLMDPAMFLITAAELGAPFALAKTLAAVGLGLLGGFGTQMLARSPVFADPLRPRPAVGGCCGVSAPFSGRPVWRFWQDSARLRVFRDTGLENAAFLLKWLMLAYLLEALMLRYVPTEAIVALLGGEGLWPVLKGAFIGAPAYLNGYMAVGMVGGFIDQGMTQGAAMAFVVAGGVSCIPAAIAVWALVKPRVFAAYLGFAILGAIIAGGLWQWVS